MKIALVTGDVGFIGRHVRRELYRRGWYIAELDVKRNLREDVRNFFHDLSGQGQFDLVVHCAAVVGGRDVISNDPLAVAVNLELDAAMFRWAVRTKQPRVVYMSSCAVYPTALQVEGRPSAEEDQVWNAPKHGTPDSTYGWAKLTGERLAGYARAEGVRTHVVRPFSGYGADQDETYPFPAFVARALRRDDPFEVWGDGRQVRDFVHVDDIVGTIMAMVDQDVPGPLNVGWGRATSFNDLAALVTGFAGYTPDLLHRIDKPTGPTWRVADTTESWPVYRPKITLEEGIARALKVGVAP